MELINEPEFTVDYFINKFEAIPEQLWCVNEFVMGDKHCALGHCGFGLSHTPESEMLTELLWMSVTLINDGYDSKYQQPTPKQRILAALNDIKNKQL